MAIRYSGKFFNMVVSEDHDTMWVWEIDKPRTYTKEASKNWKLMLGDLDSTERYWLRYGGWARKADCQKFINGLKKKYGYQVLKKLKPQETGVWDQDTLAKNAVKSKSMDW